MIAYQHQLSRSMLWCAAIAYVCAVVACVDGERSEDRPIDARDNVLVRGLVDCTQSTDVGYTQGNAFDITVVTVDGKAVERDTANAYAVMQDAADLDGVQLRVVSGFRTMAEQEYFYACYQNCDCNNCNLAAVPGTSNHQSGHALDLNTSDSGVLSWLNSNGARFGFERTVASEDWHWEWWGGGPGGGPCGSLPSACVNATYTGAFCDDEDSSSQDAQNCLAALGVDFHCDPIASSPAYCGGAVASRAQGAFVFGAAALIPLSGHLDGWIDDDGHIYEPYLDAFKAYDIYFGTDAGTRVSPDVAMSRTTVATVLSRMYALPEPTADYFTDDNGSDGERAHNQLGDLGFTFGCGSDGNAGRIFCGSDVADRATLARFACGVSSRTLTPVWLLDAPPDPPGDPADPPPDDPIDTPPSEAPPESTPKEHVFASSVSDTSCGATSASAPVLLLWASLLRRRPRAQLRRNPPSGGARHG